MKDALVEHIDKVIHVGREEIVFAKQVDQCPVAVSIMRDFRDYFHNVTVGGLKTYFNDIDDKHYEDGIGVTMATRLRAWLRAFDQRKFVEPIKIVLKRYDAPAHINHHHYEFDLV